MSTTIANYPVPATRNSIANELSAVIDIVWTGMNKVESNPQFLKECYVIPPASADSLRLATEMLAERRRKDDVTPAAGAVESTRALEILKGPLPEKPILVLGRVGHGKSTFLRYLRTVAAVDTLKSYVQLDIDFLDRPDDAAGVPRHIYNEIERLLREQYQVDITEDKTVRGMLDSAIARFSKSPRGVAFPPESEEYKSAEIDFIESITSERHDYLRYVMQHLQRGRRLSVTVFLDNLDRRDDKIQEEAFLRASAMARDWGCLVFVCLRPGTFHRSRSTGVLDSLAPQAIGVTAPDAAIMLKKRFSFAIRIARGEAVEVGLQTGAGSRTTAFDLPTVASFLECCKDSFWHNRSLVDLFEAASNGNPRDLLRLVNEVLSSEHLNTSKILQNLKSGYRIPAHEALRALLYGDSMHFSPTRSRFINLFDVEHDDEREHFTRILVLSLLQRIPPSSATHGFVVVADIEQYLCQIGYSVNVANGVIQHLYKNECVEGKIAGVDWSQDVSSIRITTLGRYHVNHLAGQFQYVDAVIVDTPIIDSQVRAKVRDVSSIFDRIDRATLFVDYLKGCAARLQDADAQSAWREIENRLRDDIHTVKTRVESRTA